MRTRVQHTADGKSYRVACRKPGPKPHGYVKVLVNLPVAHLELMRIRNEECGGMNSVNEQIRAAVRGYLCGLVYISLVNT